MESDAVQKSSMMEDVRESMMSEQENLNKLRLELVESLP